MNVPFFDLKRQLEHIEPVMQSALHSTIQSGQYVGGDAVHQFEKRVADHYHLSQALGVGNGTDALVIALRIAGVKKGDEVIIPAYTYVGTANAVLLAGGIPVMVDVDPVSYTLDPDLVSSRISKKTRAIVPVHLYGQMAEMAEIQEIASNEKLILIEDAAQAHGAHQKDHGPGHHSLAACMSFYPTKQLGAYGDGGAVLSNDSIFIESCREYANHGGPSKIAVGVNSRLDTIQAAMLDVKINYLEDWIEARRKIARQYDEGLNIISEVQLPQVMKGNFHTYYNYPVRVPDPVRLKRFLKEQGVATKRNYDYALSNCGLFGRQTACPVAESLANEMLCLPMFPELTSEEVDYVIDNIKSFFG